MNVGAGPHPPDDFPLLVTYRQGPAQRPPVFAGVMTHPIFDFVCFSGCQTLLPAGPGQRPVRRVEQVIPALAIRAACRYTGKLVPPLVEIIVMAVCPRGPDHLWHGIGNRPEFRFTLLDGLFGQSTGRYIAGNFRVTKNVAPLVVQSPDDNLGMVDRAVLASSQPFFFIAGALARHGQFELRVRAILIVTCIKH